MYYFYLLSQLLDGSPRGGKNDVLSRMRQTYDEQTRKLESRLEELKAQLAAAYAGIQASNKKSAEQTTVSSNGGSSNYFFLFFLSDVFSYHFSFGL